MSSGAFIALAILTLAAALGAALLPQLVHAALCFAAAFVGVAGLYFLLGAEFVGLVQVFVYVGAVAVLIVFTILLTRRETKRAPSFRWSGAIIAAAVFVGLVWTIGHSAGLQIAAPEKSALSVRQIGQALMLDYVWPLQCVGVLLTAALIGALILVREDKR